MSDYDPYENTIPRGGVPRVSPQPPSHTFVVKEKHKHYYKDVTHLASIDVYRVLDLFGVTDQAIGHAIKKLLVAGGRGAGKDLEKDISEVIDTLLRRREMKEEDMKCQP